MKLLLLGCTGFIGKELIPKLINSGHELTIITRQNQSTLNPQLKNKNIHLLKLDPSSIFSWEDIKLLNAVKESEGIINLAGESIADKRWNKKQCKKIRNSRVLTTQYLIKTINQLPKPPRLLINGSAIGFYGTSENLEFNEDSLQGNDFLANVCKEWEQAAFEKPQKTRLIILRIGIVLEKDGGALGKMLPIFRAGLGGPIGDGRQWMTWIHRADICEIINQAILNQSWKGTINAVAPNPVLMSKFSETLGKSLNRPSLLSVPGPILKLLLGDGAKIVLEGQKVMSKKLKKLGFNFTYPDLSSAIDSITK